MKLYNINYMLLLLLLMACNNGKKEEYLMQELAQVSNKYGLKNGSLEFVKGFDSNAGSKNNLNISFELDDNIDNVFKKNLDYLSNIIAYDIYETLDQMNKASEYSKIDIILSKNGQIQKNYNYEISDLIKAGKGVELTERFQKYMEKKDYGNIRNIISLDDVPDSTLKSIYNGIKYMEKCGVVKSNDLLGYNFDETEDNEEVTVIVRYLKREFSEEQYTFYITNKENKIIFIDAKSNMACEN